MERYRKAVYKKAQFEPEKSKEKEKDPQPERSGMGSNHQKEGEDIEKYQERDSLEGFGKMVGEPLLLRKGSTRGVAASGKNYCS